MFEPLNALERMLIAAATEPSARTAFIQAMLETDLYCSPAGDVAQGAPIGPMVVAYLEDGQQAAALFTAPERLREVVGADARILARIGRALLEELGANPIQLNPNLVPSVIWSAEDIDEILAGPGPVHVPAGTEILLSHPAQTPTALIAALKSRLSSLGAVKGAWLLQADRGAGPYWLVGVDLSGPWEPIGSALNEALQTVDLAGRVVEATPLTQSSLADALRGGIPIVAPKKRGLFDFLKG